MKKGEHVLLMGPKSFYVVVDQNYNTEYGIIKLETLLKAKYGDTIKTHIGKKFTVARPTILDFYKMRASRGPQIAHAKDVGLIISMTGVSSGWNCFDAGAGSGFMSLFLASICKPGKVIAYEKVKKHYEIVKKNAEDFGADNLTVKFGGAQSFKEKGFDLMTLDMEGVETMIPKVKKALNPGGWLVVFSPILPQVEKVYEKLNEVGGFSDIITKESFIRDWKIVTGWSRPDHHMLGFTGFLTFARKV